MNKNIETKKSETGSGVERQEGIQVEKSVMINSSPEEIYGVWRDFENLPRFMKHLKSVRVMDAKRSHWVAKAPVGSDVEWDAEIINEVRNEVIGWQSLDEADVRNAGSVHFERAGNNQTQLRVVLRYDPPAGKLGAVVAKLLGESPEHELAEDLKRFKQMMEGGEFTQARRAV